MAMCAEANDERATTAAAAVKTVEGMLVEERAKGWMLKTREEETERGASYQSLVVRGRWRKGREGEGELVDEGKRNKEDFEWTCRDGGR